MITRKHFVQTLWTWKKSVLKTEKILWRNKVFKGNTSIILWLGDISSLYMATFKSNVFNLTYRNDILGSLSNHHIIILFCCAIVCIFPMIYCTMFKAFFYHTCSSSHNGNSSGICVLRNVPIYSLAWSTCSYAVWILWQHLRNTFGLMEGFNTFHSSYNYKGYSI